MEMIQLNQCIKCHKSLARTYKFQMCSDCRDQYNASRRVPKEQRFNKIEKALLRFYVHEEKVYNCDFSKWLFHAMIIYNYVPYILSDLIGYNQGTIQRWLYHETTPNEDAIYKLQNLFGIKSREQMGLIRVTINGRTYWTK